MYNLWNPGLQCANTFYDIDNINSGTYEHDTKGKFSVMGGNLLYLASDLLWKYSPASAPCEISIYGSPSFLTFVSWSKLCHIFSA